MKHLIANITLLTHDQSYRRYMAYSVKQERVQRTTMPFTARLAALQAVSQSTVINKVW